MLLRFALLFALVWTTSIVQAEEGLTPLKIEVPEEVLAGTPPDVLAMLFPGLEMPKADELPAIMIPAETVNLALKKPVKASDDKPILGELPYVADGEKEGNESTFVELAPGAQWVQIDLEQPSQIYAICLWHYFREARSYHDVVVQVADDAEFKEGVQTVYNNDQDNSLNLGVGKERPYIETNLGKLIDTKGVKGRYVRSLQPWKHSQSPESLRGSRSLRQACPLTLKEMLHVSEPKRANHDSAATRHVATPLHGRRWRCRRHLVGAAAASGPWLCGQRQGRHRTHRLRRPGAWIADLFREHGGYNLVAVADYFQDRIDEVGNKLQVAPAQRFTGLAGYHRMLEQKLDAVVIESPPYFHPEHAAAAVDAGKHVYLAKPIAVDVPGCKTVEQSGEKATATQRCFLVDFQTRPTSSSSKPFGGCTRERSVSSPLARRLTMRTFLGWASCSTRERLPRIPRADYGPGESIGNCRETSSPSKTSIRSMWPVGSWVIPHFARTAQEAARCVTSEPAGIPSASSFIIQKTSGSRSVRDSSTVTAHSPKAFAIACSARRACWRRPMVTTS